MFSSGTWLILNASYCIRLVLTINGILIVILIGIFHSLNNLSFSCSWWRLLLLIDLIYIKWSGCVLSTIVNNIDFSTTLGIGSGYNWCANYRRSYDWNCINYWLTAGWSCSSNNFYLLRLIIRCGGTTCSWCEVSASLSLRRLNILVIIILRGIG